MSTLRISNIEAKADVSSPTVDEKLKFTNSIGNTVFRIDGKNAGITTIGINTTASTITVNDNQRATFVGEVASTKFIGPFEATSGTVNGNLTVTGVLSYQDVTNVDSIGIITARKDVRVGGNLNAVGITTLTGPVAFGDTATFGDHDKIKLGDSGDLIIYHDASNSIMSNTTGELLIDSDIMNIRSKTGGESYFYGSVGAGITLFYDNSEKLRTTNTGTVTTGISTADQFKLDDISKTFTTTTHGGTDASATTNSIFVYDTRKDSDGGAWRKRTSDKSWYNEPSVVGVNTYCGARSEFPSVAVIIGAERGIFIHDGDDPDLPLWRSYAYDGGSPQPSNYYVMDNFKITAKNGIIAAARNDNTITNGGGLHFLDFILDKAVLISSNYGGQTAYDTPELTRASMQRGYIYTRTIYTSGGTYGDIQDANAISVDMEVLPNAPTKMFGAERKIPTPTFIVGLNNGLTVIDHYGRCHDLYGSSQSSGNVECTDVSITKDGYIAYSHGYGTEWNTTITANTTATYYNGTAGYQGRITNGTTHYGNTRCFAIGAVIYTKAPTSTFAISRSTDGLTLNRCERPGFRDNDDSRRTAIIRYNSNSGWMVGDCRMACLASADSTNLTNGQSDPSREMQYSNSLTATGTVTKTAVATGAELMGYSGWSDSNYLSRTYDADFNFGATQFTVMFWAKDPDDTLKYITARGDADATETWRIGLDRNSGVYFDYGNGGSYAQSNMTLYTDWAFYVCTVHAGQKGHIYVNGNEQTYTQQGNAPGTFMNDTDWTLTVGRHPYGSGSAFPGSIALFRVSGDVPTEKVIREIYNDERQLFHQNAKCTLTGTQNSIVDMDYDDSTDTVHVGTSAGRSDFQGLVRINNTSTAVNSSVSASGGLIVEE